MKPTITIIGLHNPYSSDPRMALAPFPEQSSGWRLWKTLSEVDALDLYVSQQALRASYDRVLYMDLFKRHNLFLGHEYIGSRTKSKEKAFSFFLDHKPREGDTVVLLGKTVLRAFRDAGVPLRTTLIHPQEWQGITWRWLPHPSGRNLIYNDPDIRGLVGMMLADLITVQENT